MLARVGCHLLPSNPCPSFGVFSTNFAIFSILMDGFLIGVALFAADLIRPILGILPFAQDLQDPIVPAAIYPLFILAWLGIHILQSLYDGRRNLYLPDEILNLSVASLLASVSLAGLLYLSFRDVSRLLFFVFCLAAYSLMVLWRLAARLIFKLPGSRTHQRRLLIIGAGQVGQELAAQIEGLDSAGIEVLGFLDDDLEKEVAGHDLLGPLQGAASQVTQHAADDIVIALPQRAHEKINELLSALHTLPVQVWVIPDYFHFALHKASIDEFAGIPMLNLRAPALTEFQRLTKRVFDLVLSLAMLPVFLLTMAVLALLIWFEDRGPVLFSQARVGENGSLFKMLKFRSMVPGAEHQLDEVMQQSGSGHLIHKTEADPRITRIGSFIRRTSLDELPQIFNVLRGEMSLVGPRPELPFLVAQYEPWQRKRFAVPQGMTGWWQINGRSEKPMHLHTEDDLYYIQNYSILLDLRIVIRTVLVVLRGRGAF